MRKLLTAGVLTLVIAATAANLNTNRTPLKQAEEERDSVVIVGDTLRVDSITLSLQKIPKAQDLYSVAKITVGKWAKLFTVIKIEESGADGKNSFYALKYNNLTGMRWPGKGRQTTAVAKGHNSYAIFNHWHDCMLDFKFYIDIMEKKYVTKYGKQPETELEMINFMLGSYNPYGVWKRDLVWLLNHFHYK
ncbi:MAG: hypothetical protein KG003_09655 [Bacteroidetes bacterium]|nr:hypothetical protein [Bacteroidota bacterium]